MKKKDQILHFHESFEEDLQIKDGIIEDGIVEDQSIGKLACKIRQLFLTASNREPESKHCSTLRVEHGRNGSVRAA